MSEKANPEVNHPAFLGWRIYFGLAAVLGVLVIGSLLRMPSEDHLIAGISASRLVIILAILGMTVLFGLLFLQSYRASDWFGKAVVQRVRSWLDRPWIQGIAWVLTLLGAILGIYLVLLAPEISEPFARAILIRTQPLAIYAAALCTQTILMLLLHRDHYQVQKMLPRARWFILLGLLLGLFLFLWDWIVQNTFLTESKFVGWNDLGVPILETQVLIGWTLGMVSLIGFYLLQRVSERKHSLTRYITPRNLDLGVGFTLWLTTVLLWSSIPITPSWFVSEPRFPNFEFYPNSDALSYDMTSQLVLVGEDLQFAGTPFVRRPIHALFLTLLHSIGGQDYEVIVLLQILVLALLPVFIYLLTKNLHNRVSGLVASTLIMLREANSIAIAGTVTSSHAKLLMSDLPVTLAVAAFAYVLVIWLQASERKTLYPLLAGGLLGVCMLIRPEIGVMLIAVLLLMLLVYRKQLRSMAVNTGLLLFGLVLILSPWIWRNWQLTGLVFLDSPSFRFELISERYQPVEELGTATTPLEEAAEIPLVQPTLPSPTTTAEAPPVSPTPDNIPPDSRPPYLDYVSSVIDQTTSFVRENFSQTASFLFSHSMNSKLQIFLVLPTTYRLFDSLVSYIGHRDGELFWDECCSLLTYVRRLPYWHDWEGGIPNQAIVPLVINFSLIGLGLFLSWKQNRWVGLIPVFLAVSHISLNALFRNSGGRYNLAVDWIGVVYFSIGLMDLSLRGLSIFSKQPIPVEVSASNPKRGIDQRNNSKPITRRAGFYLLAISLILIGSILPILEQSIQSPYTQNRKDQMLESFLESELLAEQDRNQIQNLLNHGGSVSIGRALFPRFYPAGEGEPGTNNPMGPRDYRRVGFYLVGPVFRPVLLPAEQKPEHFPNASDVIVITDADGRAIAVGIFNGAQIPVAILTIS